MKKKRDNSNRESRSSRRQPASVPRERLWPIMVGSLLTLGLLSVVFPQTNAIRGPEAWPLAFVCLAPWLVTLVKTRRPVISLLVSYLLGVAFFIQGARWLWNVTPPGYIALTLYLGVYFPVAGWLIRYAYHRRRVGLTLAVPVIWTAAEFIRGTGVLAFPWLLLGQGPFRSLTLIQVADFGGAFAVTFVAGMVNGLVADLFLRRQSSLALAKVRPDPRVAVALTASVLVATIAYGRWRIGQATTTDGPKVTVVQGDYPLTVASITEGQTVSPVIKRRAYFEKALHAAIRHRPDMIVFPETPWRMSLNDEFLEAQDLSRADRMLRDWSLICDDWFKHLANPQRSPAGPISAKADPKLMPLWQELRNVGKPATVVVGGFATELFPTNAYPKRLRYNSAFAYTSDGASPGRYDKIHLVLFGEYVPFRSGRLHWLYLWLNSLTPWGQGGYEYSLTAGDTFSTFRMGAAESGSASRRYRFAVPICYEDTIPYVCRGFARQGLDDSGNKGVDFLVNISNDGWFGRSFELAQHLAVSTFRAVENRVAIARAVNTGMSGFIDSTGRIRDVIPVGKIDTLTRTIPIDARIAPYTRWGDRFAIGCLVASLLAVLDAAVTSMRARRAPSDEESNA